MPVTGTYDKKINTWESAAINQTASYGINVTLWRLEGETVSYFFDSCICGKQTLNKAILSSQKIKSSITTVYLCGFISHAFSGCIQQLMLQVLTQHKDAVSVYEAWKWITNN